MQAIKEMLKQTYPSTIGSNIDENGNVILSNFTLEKNEYIKDNMIYCTVCNQKKLFVGNDWQNKLVARRCVCKCYEEEQQRLKEEEERRKRLLRIERLKDRSLMDKRYKNVKFSDLDLTNRSFAEAFNRCKKYCDVSREVLNKGYGIYLYGNSGVGKTVLTACMANELMEKEYSVLFTNFYEILKSIRNTYNSNSTETDDNVINSIADVDFLFIDDLGTESLTKNSGDNFSQDKIFEIINKRYNKEKPTIFSSNYSIKDLVRNRNFMDKTVDRINEMATAVIEIKGESYRVKKVRNEEVLF